MRGTYQLGFKGFPQELRLPKTRMGQAFCGGQTPLWREFPTITSELYGKPSYQQAIAACVGNWQQK